METIENLIEKTKDSPINSGHLRQARYIGHMEALKAAKTIIAATALDSRTPESLTIGFFQGLFRAIDEAVGKL